MQYVCTMHITYVIIRTITCMHDPVTDPGPSTFNRQGDFFSPTTSFFLSESVIIENAEVFFLCQNQIQPRQEIGIATRNCNRLVIARRLMITNWVCL